MKILGENVGKTIKKRHLKIDIMHTNGQELALWVYLKQQ